MFDLCKILNTVRVLVGTLGADQDREKVVIEKYAKYLGFGKDSVCSQCVNFIFGKTEKDLEEPLKKLYQQLYELLVGRYTFCYYRSGEKWENFVEDETECKKLIRNKISDCTSALTKEQCKNVFFPFLDRLNRHYSSSKRVCYAIYEICGLKYSYTEKQ